jgi:sugar phosphate isomerase/epimerase
MKFTQRLCAAAAALVLTMTVSRGAAVPPAETGGPKLGLQGWTCKDMKFDEVVDFAAKHGIKYVEFIAAQIQPEAPKEETMRKKALLDSKGVMAYSFGVNNPTLDKEANRKLFEFAKLMGMKVIAIEPRDQKAWDNIEELVKEYDIKVAIHNHDLDSTYGNPETVKKILATRDKRIGVCLDIGWVTAAGFDAAEVFRGYGDRVYDLHFKDKIPEKGADGKKVVLDVEIGKGKANYDGLFAELKKRKWSGVLAIETDNRAFQADPNQMVAEAKKFFDAKMAK